MSTKSIPFTSEFKTSEETKYLGRNGTGKVRAVSVQKMEYWGKNFICIAPINSKGDIARSYIEIPTADVETFISALREQASK